MNPGDAAVVPTGFAARLLAGGLPLAAYADLLAQTDLVYELLEEAARNSADHPEVAPFLHPGRVRLPSLQADLEFLVGPGWRSPLVPLPATVEYLARLRLHRQQAAARA